MLSRLRKHATFSNVVALLALFIALGGAAYAGTKISGKSIKNNSIPKKKLKASALKGLDTCPSNAPTNLKGLCYGAAQGPTDWDTANQGICRPQGLRAPTIGEALVLMTSLGSGETWTDEVTDLSPNSTRGLVTAPGGPSGQIFAAPVGSSHTVRCVTNATNPTS
jgi:hypothetical protein